MKYRAVRGKRGEQAGFVFFFSFIFKGFVSKRDEAERRGANFPEIRDRSFFF